MRRNLEWMNLALKKMTEDLSWGHADQPLEEACEEPEQTTMAASETLNCHGNIATATNPGTGTMTICASALLADTDLPPEDINSESESLNWSTSASEDEEDDEDDDVACLQKKAMTGKEARKDEEEEEEEAEYPWTLMTKNEVAIGAFLEQHPEEVALPYERVPEGRTLVRIGRVQSVVEAVLVVASEGSQPTALDVGSLLVLEDDGVVLGRVFDTFGPVERPLYAIYVTPRLQTLLQAGSVPLHASVAYDSECSTLVDLVQLRQHRGCDASNLYDEALASDDQDFSDDEQESRAKTKRRATTSRQSDVCQEINGGPNGSHKRPPQIQFTRSVSSHVAAKAVFDDYRTLTRPS